MNGRNQRYSALFCKRSAYHSHGERRVNMHYVEFAFSQFVHKIRVERGHRHDVIVFIDRKRFASYHFVGVNRIVVLRQSVGAENGHVVSLFG